MKERPILFSTEMVEAIMREENPKTHTRRVNGLSSINISPNDWRFLATDSKYDEYVWQHKENISRVITLKCPYGRVGDILWVRETWCRHKGEYLYKAGGIDVNAFRWKPSIHMPKEACRIKLIVKSRRVERLLDITQQDAIAEGIQIFAYVGMPATEKTFYKNYSISNTTPNKHILGVSAIQSYLSLWDMINGKDSHLTNSHVWVIEFERVV